jgi:beta-lactamase class A
MRTPDKTKRPSPARRALLLAACSAPFGGALSSAFADERSAADSTAGRLASITPRLAQLEHESGGRLGVAVIDTAKDVHAGYRNNERFAICSTFKTVLCSAVLKRHEREPGLLDQRILYTKADLVSYSPISSKHVDDGMTVAELCAAALQYSDNSAANALIRLIGGPPAVTAFARSIGDTTFRLDRTETTLNTAIPGDPRDTSTPGAMVSTLRRVTLGHALAPESQKQLIDWMRGNTTGAKRIRARVPAEWDVADKTGTGDYGTTNDLGIVWPAQGRAPVVLGVYYTQADKDAPARDDVIASATRIVIEAIQ